MIYNIEINFLHWAFSMGVESVVKGCPPDCPCGEGGNTAVRVYFAFACLHFGMIVK